MQTQPLSGTGLAEGVADQARAGVVISQPKTVFHGQETAKVRSVSSQDRGDWVGIDQVVPYEGSPRLLRNPAWAKIEAAILASGGLTTPLAVTQRPGADVYVCHEGGNTRLLVQKELYRKTRDPRFSRVRVDLKPYDDEIQLAVLHDRENTCRGGLLYIEDASSKCRLFDLYRAGTDKKPTVRRFVDVMAKEHGLRLSVDAFSRMQYTVKVLYPHIPTCLVQGGMSLRRVKRLVTIKNALTKLWTERELGSVAMFEESFYGLLARQDEGLAESFLNDKPLQARTADPRIAIDWALFFQDMQHEIALAGEVGYQMAGAWLAKLRRTLAPEADEPPVEAPIVEAGAPAWSSGPGRARASRPPETIEDLRQTAFRMARDLFSMVGLTPLVEARDEAVGYAITGTPAPSASAMAMSCWWALVLSSTPTCGVSRLVPAGGDVPSFTSLSPDALIRLSKLLALQARLASRE